VYGATAPGRPAREDDTPAASGAYAQSKAAMEQAARAFARPGGALSLVVTRAFNHTGPRQSPEFVVPAFARQIARIEAGLEPPVVRVGNLDARRDFLDVRDVVRAYCLLLDAEPASGNFHVVNVASGEAYVIQSLLDMLVAQSRVPLRVETDPARVRPLDLPECVGDATLLRTLTGWQPRVALDQTLADTLDYWREKTAAKAGHE
jgi:GDP-4-dehydro-6-deoxy-D-mannose reductase